jgi:ADP-ribose pyrophosphatase
MEPQVLGSETLFKGRVFQVRRDRLRLEGGRETTMDLVVHPGAVALIPLDQDQQVWFVRQYRHAAGATLLELPAGTLEPGEPAERCAARECQEEIGMYPGSLEKLGGFYLAPGYSSEFLQVYLATDLHSDPRPHDSDERIEVVRLPLAQLPDAIRTGQIHDAKSLAAVSLAHALGKLTED